ncbi:MAG: aminotransferase class V-fold PLP-dependent enzyme [Clostridia bacterium]
MIPALQAWHYFNTGTAGAIAAVTADAMSRAFFEEVYHGRIRPDAWEQAGQAQADCRALLAELLQVSPDTIALTHHTTEGMNLAIMGSASLAAGDEILLTSVEHAGGMAPAALAAKRRGVTLRTVDVGAGGSGTAEAVAAAIGDKTRLIVVSHVAYGTGAVLPIRDLVRAAHERGVEVAVDGAQSVGAIPVDLADLDADYYAFPSQKWLMGPEGLGGFYIRPDHLPSTLPLMAGPMSFGFDGPMEFPMDARRFHVSSVYRPGPIGLSASLRWLRDVVGWDRVFARGAEVMAAMREAVAPVPGVEIVSPAGARSGLLVFGVAGRSAEDLVSEAQRRRILIRTVPGNRVRASAAWYLGEGDLDAFSAFAESLG